MGIEYSARIIVGLPHGELEEFLEGIEDPYDAGLYICSPYYDASYEDSLFGVVVETCDDFGYTQINEHTWQEKVSKAHDQFYKLTGERGILYLSTYGR